MQHIKQYAKSNFNLLSTISALKNMLKHLRMFMHTTPVPIWTHYIRFEINCKLILLFVYVTHK